LKSSAQVRPRSLNCRKSTGNGVGQAGSLRGVGNAAIADRCSPRSIITMNGKKQPEPIEFAAEPEDDALFEMANLSPKRTGLRFVVWISPKAGAPHDVRVKVSEGPKEHRSEFISVAIRPDVRVVGGEMSAHDLALLREWVELNRDVIIKYWDGDIEYTEDAIAALKPIECRQL
jgi:Domain of unknown function (DUF4160)